MAEVIEAADILDVALRQQRQRIHRNLNLDRHLEQIFIGRRGRSCAHENLQIVLLRFVQKIGHNLVVHLRERRLLDERLPRSCHKVPVFHADLQLSLPIDALRRGAVAERVVGVEVALDVAEGLGEVVRLNGSDAAGHVRHEAHRVSRVTDDRLRDAHGRRLRMLGAHLVAAGQTGSVHGVHRDAVRIRGARNRLNERR